MAVLYEIVHFQTAQVRRQDALARTRVEYA